MYTTGQEETSRRLRCHQTDADVFVVVAGGEVQAVGVEGQVSGGVADVEGVELVLGIGLPEVEVSAASSAC